MPLQRWRVGASALRAALPCAALILGIAATPAHALRVMTWNLAKYDVGGTVPLGGRQQNFRTVMAAINADILITQENDSQAASDSFFTNVLNVVEPGQWATPGWFALFGGEGGAIFYKPAKVAVSGVGTFSTSGPRHVLFCTVTPVGYSASSATFRLYSIHFKAGGPGPCTPMPCTSDSTIRRLECTDIRNILNTNPAGTNMLLGGDTNFYSAFEGGYTRLRESQLDNDGRLKEPLTGLTASWHANSGNALYHTQCPCNTGCLSGFSGGGMDDRFDLWLTSFSMQDGQGLDYFADNVVSHGAYPFAYGNDGTKFNNDINAGGSNGMVPIAVANALHDASDHLPVVITLQVPAKVVASSSLNFGQAILGGAPTQSLSVGNGATAPADGLTYTLTAPTDFSAPSGTFEAPVGGGNLHAIGMSTASIGNKSGTLTVNSDDPDLPIANVSLSGTVLDHAASSLDSSAIVVGSTVDFGDHPIGQFSDQALRAHNFGYDPLQARLSVNTANITGGDGRFSIVGGFNPVLLAGTGQTWNVHFNDAGATIDQVYTATLTLASTDEPLPGATAATDLVVTLRAKPLTNPVGVVPGRQLPKTLAFYPPHPNPVTERVEFAFDLPTEAAASLAIYDLSGRQVASLISGSLPADHHQTRWDMRGDDGARVAAGLYFARFATPGMRRVARLVVLP